MTQLEKHEKAIRLLGLIDDLNNRIFRNYQSVNRAIENDFFGMKDHYKKRYKIDTAIKTRLENYYNLNFKI